MSNFYDKASLVMIPSGTKEGTIFSLKPTNGDGDFTFSRSTAATRVNADGLIEKETQNLLLQSNTFNTTWVKTNTTLTSGQTGYDGSSNAWLLNKSAVFARIQQPITSTSGVKTFSVYLKAGTLSWCRVLVISAASPEFYINLADGSIGSQYNNITATSTDVGGGWYRASLIFDDTISEVRIYPADANNSVSGTSGNIYIQDAQLEQGLVARDYIETTTAAVEGGITDNVPRLDYTDSSCPALLLEPQRTNLVTQSEYLTDSSYWATTALNVIANNATSPEGVLNASFLQPTATNSGHQIYHTFSISAGTNTLSVFLKAGNYSKFRFYFYDGTTSHEIYGDCSDGSIYSTNSTASVQDYGNGWYRYSVTATNVSFGAGNFTIRVVSDSYVDTWLANGTDGLYAYGWQFEAGSYSSSLIPTYGTSQTRAYDYCINSSLTTSTDFTIFFEAKDFCLINGNTGGSYDNLQFVFSPSGGAYDSGGSYHIYNNSLYYYDGSANTDFGLIYNNQTDSKFALVKRGNQGIIYANGVKKTELTLPSGADAKVINWDAINITPSLTDAQGDVFGPNYKQLLKFDTALSDSELADLTTL